jgi:hypothetical protein
MDSAALWQTVIALLLALGGGGGIVLGLSNWLGRLWADRVAEQLKASNTQALERIKADFVRDLESYKVQLKKSEFFFQREFDAAREFSSIVHKVIPTRQRHPDMDWSEAMDDVIGSFGKTEERLEEFLELHGVVLTEDERELVNVAISRANQGNLYSAEGDPAGHEIAEKLCNDLKELQARLNKRLRDQASL